MKSNRLKVRIIALALVVIACLAAGCATKFDEQALIEKSKTYTQNLVEGDFISVVSGGSKAYQGVTNAEDLAKAWQGVTANMGEFVELLDGTFSQDKSLGTVRVIAAYENTNLEVQFVYNNKSELEGLWLNYVPKEIEPTQTDQYQEIEVEVGEEQPLKAMITLPKGVENAPAVVMVQGSGAHDMNETIGAAGNAPFSDIAHGLAEQGIASIRYNKRTYQYPEAVQPEDITIEYEVLDDAALAYQLLTEQQGVDAERIYILGHSLGGMMAPKIAQDTNAAGFISMAGSPRSLIDIIRDQNIAALQQTSATEQEKEGVVRELDRQIEQANNAKKGDKAMILGLYSNYWYSLNAIDQASIAQSFDGRMLFLQGTEDFQVSLEKDFMEWEKRMAGNSNAVFIKYDGLNHLFMVSNGQKTIEEYNVKAHVDEKVILDIAQWIQNG